MGGSDSNVPVVRRSFLTRLGLALGAVGVAFKTGESATQAQAATGSAGWQPRRHPQDDWMDRVPGSHRLVFDSTSPDGIGTAMWYANNFYLANQSGYELGNADLAVMIVLRHGSTAFAFADAMWAKYGTLLAQRINFDDPKTKRRPNINVYNSTTHSALLPSGGITLDDLAKRGVHFAVCQIATRRFAGVIAAANGGNSNAVSDELTGNLVPNAHMAAAGIVALSRAQERGYTFADAG
jgi:intracellular sulfur oxidation DsrE/DsrF family protein